MDRRWFDHLFTELSVALGRRAPRYALWLALGELGVDPAKLGREDVVGFCDRELPSFLAEHRLALTARAEQRLQRSIRRFDPRHPSPAEHMARMVSPPGS